MTTILNTINSIKSVSNDIEAAITAGHLNEAIDLENQRHEKINALANMDVSEITPEIKKELNLILGRIQEDIDIIEAAMLELNKSTGKQARQLNGYR